MVHNNNLYMYVKGLMSRTLIKCKSTDNLVTISKIFLKYNIDSIIVNKKGKDIGIVTINNIMDFISKYDIRPADIQARDLMSFPIIYVYEDEELVNAIDKLKRYDISRLVVRDIKDKDIGIITNVDFIKKICIISIHYKEKEYAHNKKNSAEFQISDIMKKIKRIDMNKSMKSVLRNLNDINKNIVIIKDNGKDAGIISKRDIMKKICLKNKKVREATVKEVINEQYVELDIGASYLQALLLFLFKKMHVAIVKRDGKIVGSLSLNDFVKRSQENYKRANKVLREGGYAKSVFMQVDKPGIEGIILTKIYQV